MTTAERYNIQHNNKEIPIHHIAAAQNTSNSTIDNYVLSRAAMKEKFLNKTIEPLQQEKIFSAAIDEITEKIIQNLL